MVVSLTDFMSNKSGTMELTVPFTPDTINISGADYKVSEKSEISLKLTIVEFGKLSVHADFSMKAIAPCDRCLKDVVIPVSVCIDRELNFNSDQEDSDSDDEYYLTGYDLDVDQMIYEEVLIGFPMKVLCREDCRGICKVCGADLNNGECGCDRTELDPRMSVIRDIFKNFNDMNKEV